MDTADTDTQTPQTPQQGGTSLSEYNESTAYLVRKLRQLEEIERFCNQARTSADCFLANAFDSTNPAHTKAYGEYEIAHAVLKIIRQER